MFCLFVSVDYQFGLFWLGAAGPRTRPPLRSEVEAATQWQSLPHSLLRNNYPNWYSADTTNKNCQYHF